MSVHDFDLARFLVGEVEEVSAWGTNMIDKRFEEGGDVDTAVTMLRFRNGALGRRGDVPPLELGLRHPDRGGRGGRQGRRGGGPEDDVTFSRRFGYEGDHYENFPDRFEVAYRLEFEAFFRTLAEGGVPAPGPDDALETL